MSAQQHEAGDSAKASTRKYKRVRSLAVLDQLPGSALINEAENCLVLDVSRTHNWRGVKDGLLPPPIKIGGRMNRYNLGKARAVARGEDWQ